MLLSSYVVTQVIGLLCISLWPANVIVGLCLWVWYIANAVVGLYLWVWYIAVAIRGLFGFWFLELLLLIFPGLLLRTGIQ